MDRRPDGKNTNEIMGKTYYAKTEAGFSSNATISQQGSEKMGLEVEEPTI